MMIRNFITALRDVVYPNTCKICHTWLVQTENELCFGCQDELPLSYYGIHNGNPVEKIFQGRIPLQFGGSYLQFHEKSEAREILHKIKYNGARDLARVLGEFYGLEIRTQYPDLKPDILVPVPLHPRKKSQRGFNQAEIIADGIGKSLGCTVRTDLLKRLHYTSSQTKKGRYDRWQNVSGIFQCIKPDLIRGQRLVIVDDVVTTGATLEACFQALSLGNPSGIGVFTLAHARG